MARWRRSVAGALVMLLVASCEDTGPPSGAPSPTSAANPGPGGPIGISGPGHGLLLTEVRFAPAPSDPSFIEITNTGSDPVATPGLTLEIDGRPLTVAPIEASLAPGERLLVVLDGPGAPESHIVHLESAALGSEAGAVALLDGADQRLDRVAWGSGQLNAVSLVVGDFVPDSVEPGTTIGRPPGADEPFQSTAWVSYPPEQATPGVPNAVPRVEVLLPIDGAILSGAEATLDWYPVQGAVSYHAQIGTDDSFSAPLVDTTVSEPQLESGPLAPGHYVWRVQSIAADGSTSGVSEPSGFELRAGKSGRGPAAADDAGKQLKVPWLVQHKDTTMLLLEEPHEHAPMAWDMAHVPASRNDPADQKNCALAMVAMVNHFYGGDLSQDRIGYELLKDRRPGGPEEDLMYGYGLNVEQTNTAFAFALGAPVTFVPEYTSYDDAWEDITAAIDAGRPLAGAGPHHGFVVTGYKVETNGHRVMTVNDPARGQLPIDLDTGRGKAENLSLWLLPEHPTARMQEKSVTTDSDGDEVVDFDETERFKTNPNDPDSDADTVRDKQDIVSGVFDPDNGYVFNWEGSGRDWDHDGVPTERDPDSDGGGCQDGEEDKDGDGHRTGSETWNFDETDDACKEADTSVTYQYEANGLQELGGVIGVVNLSSDTNYTVTVDVHLRRDGNRWIDDGSTYSVSGEGTGVEEHSSEGVDCKRTSTSEYSGNGDANVALTVDDVDGALLHVSGVSADVHTSFSTTGSFTDLSGAKKSCDEWPFLTGRESSTGSVQLSIRCPRHGSAVKVSYDVDSHSADLACTDTVSSPTGSETATMTGVLTLP